MPQPSDANGFREAIRREALRRELRELAQRYDLSEGRLGELQDEQEAVRRELAEVQDRSAPEEQRSAVRLAELRRLRHGLGYGPDEPDPAAVLYQAAIVADVGSEVPDFSYYGRVKRWVARGTARIVLFFAGIVTSHQRIFNNRIVRVLSAVAARNEDVTAGLVRLQTETLTARLRGIEASLTSWEAAAELRAVTRTLDETIDGLSAGFEQRMQSAEERLEALAGDASRLGAAAASAREVSAAESERVSTMLTDARRRLQRLERTLEARSRGALLPEPVADGVSGDDGEVLAGSAALDRLYAAFEERFRGSREDIRNRIGEYLPAVKGVEAVSEERPLVDLGSGRGEWLELLRDAGVPAYGVDRNQVFAEVCRGMGLRVVEVDVLQHLRVQPRGSLGAVTAFHVIEHLPPSVLIELIGECRRVLAPGGLLILETPNPENLTVGGASFYSDPSHVRPVYPATLLFLLQRLGFGEVGLHWPETGREPQPQIPEVDADRPEAASVNAAARAINEHLRAPLDYAVFARDAE